MIKIRPTRSKDLHLLLLIFACCLLANAEAKKDKDKGKGGNMIVMMGGGSGGGYPMPMPIPVPMCMNMGKGKHGHGNGVGKGATREKIVIIPIPANLMTASGAGGGYGGEMDSGGHVGGGGQGAEYGGGPTHSIMVSMKGFGGGEYGGGVGGGGGGGGYGAASHEYAYELAQAPGNLADNDYNGEHYASSSNQLYATTNDGVQVSLPSHLKTHFIATPLASQTTELTANPPNARIVASIHNGGAPLPLSPSLAASSPDGQAGFDGGRYESADHEERRMRRRRSPK